MARSALQKKGSGRSPDWEDGVAQKRPRGVLALGWACFESAAYGRTEHRPTSADYPDTIVRRTSFIAGGELGWRISVLTTPRERPAPWKIVVVTGAPSWAEYWAPALAALPQNREMVVVDRPGFAASEPFDCVPDIESQAKALAPVLDAAPGQRILLVGQSYGAAIATLMATAQPRRVAALVLLSSYLGEPGPTARWLVKTGSRFLNLLPRDLRNAVMEVSNQAGQLAVIADSLPRLRAPVHVIHGELDDFAPLEVAERLAREARTRRPVRFERVSGANHFFNDGPVATLLGCLETCIAAAETEPARRMPALPRFPWRLGKGASPQAATA
jgi:pimeloyl-ACP methyl ester carboxylesterase